MAAVVAAVSLAVVVASPLDKFPEIEHACLVTHLADPDCVAGAYSAGISTLVAFILVVITALWAMRWLNMSLALPVLVPPLLTKLFLAFFCVLIFAHLVTRELAPAYSSRIGDLSHFSTFTSVENLLWPLLVQLLLLEKDWRLRSTISAVLMLILILTPYRAVSLAIFAFSFVLPLVYLLWAAYRAAWAKRALWAVANRAVLVALVGCAILSDGTVDSQTRAVTATPLAATGHEPGMIELSTMGRVRQRLAFPLYQAAIVSYLSKTTKLPTVIDELERKFRLNDKPNLNEFTYNTIYPGIVTLGQTTSLYYGEGAAYLGKAGLLWTLGAPLMLVVAWLLLRRAGLEVGAILSIALWRSSFAGLITILPALLFQLSAMFVMCRLGRLVNSGWLKAPMVSHFATGFLLIAVLAAAAAQAWASLHDPQRRDVLRLEFVAKSGCEFDMTNIGRLPDRVDQTLISPGRTFKSSLTFYTPERLYLILPYGKVLKQHLSAFIAPVSNFTKCKPTNDSSSVEIGDVRTVSSFGIIPLDLLTFVSMLVTAFLLAQTFTKALVFPSFAAAIGK